jgi:acetyl-CoA C-acetyltransferase
MADAFIYDAVRTPRGRGKPDGSLHEVPAVDLAVTTLDAIRTRNDLDPMVLEDVVLGCVDPVGAATSPARRCSRPASARRFRACRSTASALRVSTR